MSAGIFDKLARRVPLGMDRDQIRFRNRLRKLCRQRDADNPGRTHRQLEALAESIEHSIRLRERRVSGLPVISAPQNLPIGKCWERLAQLIDEHQVCVIAGTTGSGKSTQIPKICLQLGRGTGAYIGQTQPRRLAARRVAAHLNSELGSAQTRVAAAKIRFSDETTESTYVKVMTDGILLGELHDDDLLRSYDTLIIDEVHERSLNIDFLLGYLKRILPRRPDLKVIVTSATLDTQALSEHFGGAPVVSVEGSNYAVEVSYRPAQEESDEFELAVSVAEAVDSLNSTHLGDVLVFLPGEREINDVAARLNDHDRCEVHKLFGGLDSAAQDKVFAPSERTKIILSTNVAETSVTVPGVGYVIDTGLARVSRYSHRSKIQRLPVEIISKASAAQRAGRCGRTGPGRCIRLYDQRVYERMREFTPPEIKRTNLASVILRMKSLRLGEVEAFPFLDPPDPKLVRDGMRLLTELGALTDDGCLTETGKQLARLPVDPRVGRMLIAAVKFDCLREMLVLAALMSVRDPFTVPAELRSRALEARRHYTDKHSDLMGCLTFWMRFERVAAKSSNAELRKLCRTVLVSWRRMLEWRDVYEQLCERVSELGLSVNRRRASHANIYKAILTGCLTHIGRRTAEGDYQGARGSRFRLSSGSVLHGKNPAWVMCTELTETRRVYAHRVSRIRPEWIEECAAERLLRRSFAEPYFDPRRGQVFAYERVQLHGLPVVTGRKRPYDAADPEDARQVFITHALVGGLVRSDGAFLLHNRRLVERLEGLAERMRRTDILADELRMVEFYDARLPGQITRTAKFERWRLQAEADNDQVLHMREADVRDVHIRLPKLTEFPDKLAVRGYRFPVRYRLAPGAEDDGATLTLPAVLINQFDDVDFEWGVPGWLGEKIMVLLRGLPKELRRRLVPLPETVRWCLEELDAERGGLLDQLQKLLAERSGIVISRADWGYARLPEFLNLRVELVDDQLQPMAVSRDIRKLWARFSDWAAAGFERIRTRAYDRDGLLSWCFSLPESVRFSFGDFDCVGYPALIDCQSSVAIRVLDTGAKAEQATVAGLRRLGRICLEPDLVAISKRFSGLDELGLLYSSLQPSLQHPSLPRDGAQGLTEELLDVLVRRCLFDSLDGVIRSRDDFDAWLMAARQSLPAAASRLGEIMLEVLRSYHRLSSDLVAAEVTVPAQSLNDMCEQLHGLIYRGFTQHVELAVLQDYPRYLGALEARLGKARSAGNRDLRRLQEYLSIERRVGIDRGKQIVRPWSELDSALQELRVVIFAQEIGARPGISVSGVLEAFGS